MIRGEEEEGITGDGGGAECVDNGAEGAIRGGDGGFKISQIFTNHWNVRQVGGHGDGVAGKRIDVKVGKRPVGLDKADLGEERTVTDCVLGDEAGKVRGDLGTGTDGMHVLVAATLCRPGLVLHAEEMGLIAGLPEELGQMLLAGVQVVGKAHVGEADDAIGMGEATSPEGSTGWATLGGGAEAVFEADAGGGELVNAGRTDAGYAVAAKVLTQIVTNDDDDVVGLVHGYPP